VTGGQARRKVAAGSRPRCGLWGSNLPRRAGTSRGGGPARATGGKKRCARRPTTGIGGKYLESNLAVWLRGRRAGWVIIGWIGAAARRGARSGRPSHPVSGHVIGFDVAGEVARRDGEIVEAFDARFGARPRPPGRIRPQIDRVWPLDQGPAKAQRIWKARGEENFGKIVPARQPDLRSASWFALKELRGREAAASQRPRTTGRRLSRRLGGGRAEGVCGTRSRNGRYRPCATRSLS